MLKTTIIKILNYRQKGFAVSRKGMVIVDHQHTADPFCL